MTIKEALPGPGTGLLVCRGLFRLFRPCRPETFPLRGSKATNLSASYSIEQVRCMANTTKTHMQLLGQAVVVSRYDVTLPLSAGLP